MAESIFSAAWYRVAGLHPRLRSHVRVQRRVYRDRTWFILEDRSSGRHHRVNETAYAFVGRLDGTRSVQQAWDAVLDKLGQDAPTQDEVIRILHRLNDSDLLQAETSPDAVQVFARRDERARKRRRGSLNPLAFRVPLWDPTPLLDRLEPLARWLFHPLCFAAWLAFVACGTLAAATHWDAIRAHAAVHMLTPRYLLLLWLCYPAIKALHELGHALAVRTWGGAVHEVGITLLVLTPVPYVDASAATALREKHRRVIVGAAGIMVELLLAALALALWLAAADGLVRDFAFVIMFVGAVSTVVFNANPLMRFDGYYILTDLLDLPNFAARSNEYLVYLAKRYLLGVNSAVSPALTGGERAWLGVYGVAALVYRVLILVWIIFWLGAKWLVVALGLAIWAAVTLLVKPLNTAMRFLASAPELDGKRARAGLATAAAAGVVGVLTCILPLPLHTVADGVVWLPDQARVRAGADGFVTELLAVDGQQVKQGQPLIVLDDPTLYSDRERLRARLEGLDTALHAALTAMPVRAQSVSEEIASARAELAQIEERLAQMQIRSGADGVLVVSRPHDLIGRFAAKGTVLAHVLSPEPIRVRVAVPQQEADLVRQRLRSAEVRLADDPQQVLAARFERDVPAATDVLPSAALADRNGGSFMTDPADPQALHTLEPVFLFDLTLPGTTLERVGARARVRIHHGAEPLVWQWYRSLRQIFLKHVELAA